jgi:hypothetical protein
MPGFSCVVGRYAALGLLHHMPASCGKCPLLPARQVDGGTLRVGPEPPANFTLRLSGYLDSLGKPSRAGSLDSMGKPSRSSSLDSCGKPTRDYPPKTLDCLGIFVGLFRYVSDGALLVLPIC